MLTILYILIVVLIVIAVINGLYGHVYKVVNMPSTPSTRRMIINDIQDIKRDCNGLTIYECGSGWGGFVDKLARAFPLAIIKGYEISPIPYAVSKILKSKRTEIEYKNLFECDFAKADIIIVYLSPYHMEKLLPILENQLRGGSLVYSQGFPFKAKKEDAVLTPSYSIEKKIYRYRF